MKISRNEATALGSVVVELGEIGVFVSVVSRPNVRPAVVILCERRTWRHDSGKDLLATLAWALDDLRGWVMPRKDMGLGWKEMMARHIDAALATIKTFREDV